MSATPAPPVFVWHNGSVLPASEVRISPFDHGLTVGDGAFEALVAIGGRVFATRRHYERLCRSCAGLGLEVPPKPVLDEAMAAVISANGLSDARLRITVTGGEAPLGSDKGNHAPTVLVAASPKPLWPSAARVIVVPWPRNENGALSGLKTTSYGENVVALAHAKSHGGDEALFGTTHGFLCEGTGTNVFWARDGRLFTPPLASGCLAGVTRAVVLELAKKGGLSVEEVLVPRDVLREADEAFLTSTTRDVQAISHVDGQPLPAAPGPMTLTLQKAWRQMIADGDFEP